MSPYQYRDPHVEDKMVLRPSYLKHGNSHTQKRCFFILKRDPGHQLPQYGPTHNDGIRSLYFLIWNTCIDSAQHLWDCFFIHYSWLCESKQKVNGNHCSGMQLQFCASLSVHGYLHALGLGLVTRCEYCEIKQRKPFAYISFFFLQTHSIYLWNK